MLILTAILITLITPLAVLGLSFLRLKSGYLWLTALVSTFIAWVLILSSWDQMPISIPLVNWQRDSIFSASPVLLVDQISWYFAVAAVTLPLVVLLTDVIRLNELNPQTWALIQALGCVGLIAVVAGNPLTMLLAWAMTDIVESLILLFQVTGSIERERVVISFSIRIASMIILISAILRAESLVEIPLDFENIPPEVGGYLILAAGLRLGLLPTHQLHLRQPPMQRGLGTLIYLMPITIGVVLLVRTSQVGITESWASVFMILAVSSAILGAIAWLQADDEIQGRPYWILGMSSYAMAATIQKLPAASLAWGLAMLFSGACLFLFSARHRRLMIFPILGMVGFSTLPLTPSWEGSALFLSLTWGYRLIFLVALALMIVGYLRFALRSGSINGDFDSSDFERWMWLVYPLGLALLPLTHFGLIYAKWMPGFREVFFQSPWWWVGFIPLGIAVLLIFFGYRQIFSVPLIFNRITNTLDWGYRFLWFLYRITSRSLNIITRLLEGEGSVLWMLLILIMLIVTLNLWSGGYAVER
jgi:hypothetical protein